MPPHLATSHFPLHSDGLLEEEVEAKIKSQNQQLTFLFISEFAQMDEKEMERRRRPLPLAYAMEGEEVEERLILKPHLSGPRLDLSQANQVMIKSFGVAMRVCN